MTDAASTLAAWLIDAGWQTAALAAGVLAADLLLARRGFARTRHALWLLVLVKFALPPSWSAPWSVREIVAPGAAVPGSEAAPPAAMSATLAAQAAIVVWISVALALAVRATLRAARFRREVAAGAAGLSLDDAPAAALRRAATRLGLRRLPRVVVTRAVAGPALAGWFRTTLLVPAAPLGAAAAEHAFLHELAHFRRMDLRIEALAVVVRTIWWWHPAAWLASSRVAGLREVCCDLDAAAACGDAHAYRETLLDAAERIVVRPAAGVAWAGTGALSARIEALRDAPRPVGRFRRAAGVASFAAVAACALPMAAHLPPRTEQDLAVARHVVAEGTSQNGCLRVRHAVMQLAAATPSQEKRP